MFFTISSALSIEFVTLQKERTVDSGHVHVATLFASLGTDYWTQSPRIYFMFICSSFPKAISEDVAYSYMGSDDPRPLEVLVFGQITRVRLKQLTYLLRLCLWPLCWEKLSPYWGRLCHSEQKWEY